MKKILPNIFLLFLFFALHFNNACAQHEYDIWYFGDHAGIDFSSGSPSNLIDGNVSTVEGSAVISDTAGNLLFYTDGVTVWNKLHNVMTNGNNLNGGESSTQSALILKQPGNDSLYYIFTVGQAQTDGLQYSIVDMTLQSGNGEVVVKNILLLSNTTEKLTAARNSNGIDYWIITHEIGNKEFDAFQFGASGVNLTPVVSDVGTTHNSEIGYMKSSHKGLKIAVAEHSDYFFELFDFDIATGIVSNPVHFNDTQSSLGPYGIEFSPNDSILYGSAYSPGIVYQWDLSSNNASQIIASQISVATSSNEFVGALQLASDGKIYLAKYFDYYLGVFNNPNTYGTGCDYIDNGFNLSPKQSEEGLPNCFPGFFLNSQLPTALFSANTTQGCITTCVDFTDLSTNTPTSWQWLFPGATPPSSIDQNPSNICYASSGSYDVTLISTNASGSDSLIISAYITIYPEPVVSISQSGDTLFATSAESYQWFMNGNLLNGDTTQSIIISQPGTYSLMVTDSNGCFSSDTLVVNSIPSPDFFATDTSLCEKFCINFSDQSSNNPIAWQWLFPGGSPSSSTDQNPVNICYDVPGTYDVTLITTSTNGSDTLTLPNYIIVNPTPPAPTITQAGLTLTSSTASTYQWQLNSVDIPGATNQSYTILETGLYTVIVSDDNGCNNSASLYVLISGINSEENDLSIFIYPNPSSGNFTIELLNSTTVGEVSIDVVNTLGQIIASFTEKISSFQFKKEINLGDVACGVYLVDIKIGNNLVYPYLMRKKIVITQKQF
jgi:PKD repeat protein